MWFIFVDKTAYIIVKLKYICKKVIIMAEIYSDGQRIVDSFGRERIFNGINVCDKGRYNVKTGKRDYGTLWQKGLAKKLKASGITLIRLGITWDAVESRMGIYDDKFLDFIKDILDECAEAGVSVYLDMHQDLYSGFGDGDGDGAPDWACMTGKHKFIKPKFVWAEGYFFGKAVHTAFDNFWSNAPLYGRGIQDRYADMWAHIAEKLDTHPAVMGFDVMNEPFPGSDGGKVFRKLIANLVSTTVNEKSIKVSEIVKLALNSETRHEVLDIYDGENLRKVTSAADEIIKRFDTERYLPFLNKITTAIRKAGNDKTIFMENSYYSNLGIPYSCPVPSPTRERDKNIIFAPHAYDFMVDTPEYKYANNDRIKAIFDEHKRAQKRLNVPVIVGEWGGFTEGNEWFHHIKFLLKLFDFNKWSHTYWTYFNGFLETELFTDVLTRPYPMAVTGEIESYCHDREENTFELKYRQEKAYEAPTEIFLHKAPVSVDANGSYVIEKTENGDCAVLKLTTNIGENYIQIQF